MIQISHFVSEESETQKKKDLVLFIYCCITSFPKFCSLVKNIIFFHKIFWVSSSGRTYWVNSSILRGIV